MNLRRRIFPAVLFCFAGFLLMGAGSYLQDLEKQKFASVTTGPAIRGVICAGVGTPAHGYLQDLEKQKFTRDTNGDVAVRLVLPDGVPEVDPVYSSAVSTGMHLQATLDMEGNSIVGIADNSLEFLNGIRYGSQNVQQWDNLNGGILPTLYTASEPAAGRITHNQKYERNGTLFEDNNNDLWLMYARSDLLDTRADGDVDDTPYMLYYKISRDGGVSWSYPHAITNARPTGFYQKEVSAFQDTGGKIWVYTGSGDSGTYRPLIYYTTDDYGTNWTDAASVQLYSGGSPWNIDTHNPLGGSRLGHSHVIYDGSVTGFHLVFQASGGSYIRYAQSTDGTNWPNDIVSIYNSGHYVPKIYSDTNNLYVVSTKGSQIWLADSSDLGATWYATNIVNHSSSWDPYISRMGTNMVMVWAPVVGSDGQQLKMVTSPDDGVTWTTNDTKILTTGRDATREWWDYWPCTFAQGDTLYVAYTSEKDIAGRDHTCGNMWVYRYGDTFVTGTPVFVENDPVYSSAVSTGMHLQATLDMEGYSIVNIGTNSLEFEDGTVLSAGTVSTLTNIDLSLYIKTNDTRYIPLTDADVRFRRSAYTNSPVIQDELTEVRDERSITTLYGDTNVHTVVPGARTLSMHSPVDAWVMTVDLGPGTNHIGTFATTNVNINVQRGGIWQGEFFAQKISGNRDAQAYIELCWTGDNGTTTNCVGRSELTPVITETLAPYAPYVAQATNIVHTNLITLINYYLVRDSAAGTCQIATYGGGSIATHLATPGIGDFGCYALASDVDVLEDILRDGGTAPAMNGGSITNLPVSGGTVSFNGWTVAIDTHEWQGDMAGAGSTTNNAVSWCGYSTFGYDTNRSFGDCFVSYATNVCQDKYYNGFVKFSPLATNMGANGVALLVRSTSTDTNLVRVDATLFDATVSTNMTDDMISTNVGEWAIYTLPRANMPTSWQTVKPSFTCGGASLNGIGVELDVSLWQSNRVQCIMLLDEE